MGDIGAETARTSAHLLSTKGHTEMSYDIGAFSHASRGRPEPEAEPSWAATLRVACATLAGSERDEIEAIRVVVTLNGPSADVGELLAFSRSLAAQHGLQAELQGFSPPRFAVRLSRSDGDASRTNGVAS